MSCKISYQHPITTTSPMDTEKGATSGTLLKMSPISWPRNYPSRAWRAC